MSTPHLPNWMTPVVEGYGMTAPGGVQRTEVAGGMSRVALQWDCGVAVFRVTLILDDTQFSVWNAFFLRTIRKGAISFTMPLDSGFGTSDHLATMVPGSYSANRTAGVLYAVSFQVEAEPGGNSLSDADADALLGFYNEYGRDSDAMLARLHQFANLDTLVLGT
ncbi:hypothetical protein [Malikia sp.]|uniref:hypothetical protein n=1 Tax=Malikia sp. TaxID=2070706 RepID=UPI002615CF14|nr:hypothetical protein [Malikia sp.]MDD2728168.1 hypothetical protein [Malikia sp.]